MNRSLIKIHYAWIVAAVTFLALIVSAAVRSAPGILIVPLEQEFGWSRATISLAVSVNLLLYGLIGPFAAGLINRYGLRKVMLLAFTIVSVGVSSTTLMQSSSQLVFLWGVLVGCGTGMTAIVLGAAVAHRWFHSHRGLVVGVLTASTATGQLLFLPLLAYLVERDGWRFAVLSLAGVLLLVLPLIFLLMRDSPEQLGLRPYGSPGEELRIASSFPKNPFAEAVSALKTGLRSRDFWLLSGSFFICGASTNGLIGTHLVPACMDHGMPEVRAAGLLAMMGAFDLIGTTASGWLSDRFSNRWLLFTYYGLRGVSLLFLPGAFAETHRLSIFAVFYGLDWIATVPPTVALTAKSFGRERVTLMFGWIIAAHQVGAALAAWGAGWVRTTEGAYDRAFLLSGGLCVLTAGAVLLIGRGKSSRALGTSGAPSPADSPSAAVT
jgi:predicted MFS family arabinose efflux permease